MSHVETAIETCAAHGCEREPDGASRFCMAHQPPSVELCRAVWRALTAAKEPGTQHARITLRAIGAQLGCHVTTVWRAVAPLERLGYVRRCGRDHLIVLVGFGEGT